MVVIEKNGFVQKVFGEVVFAPIQISAENLFAVILISLSLSGTYIQDESDAQDAFAESQVAFE